MMLDLSKMFPLARLSELTGAPRRRPIAVRLLIGLPAVGGLLTLAVSAAHAGTKTWTGSAASTDWAIGANWGGTAPASADTLVFTSANASPSTTLTNTLTNSAFVIGSVTFNANAPAYTMTGNTFALGTGGIINNSGALQTFANTGGLSASGAQTFNLSASGGIAITGGLANASAGNLGVTVNGTGGLLTLGGFDLANATSGNVARADSISGAGNVTINGPITATGGATALTSSFTYSGTGTLTLTGATASNYTGLTVLNSGTTVLDFSTLSTPTNLLSASSGVFLAGGNLVIKGQSGAAATSQTLASLSLNPGGASGLTLVPNGGAGTTVTFGSTLNRGAGFSTLNVDISQGGTVATTLAAGTLGYVTVKDQTGTGFARATGAGLVRLTGQSTFAATGNVSTTDYVTSGNTTLTGAASVNSLTIDTSSGGGTLDLGGNTLGFTQRALLVTGGNNFTIQNGQLGSNGVETVVHNMGAGTLTINAPVSNGAAYLTTDGPGTTVLASANTYTGATSVEAGTLNLTGSLTGTPINVSLGANFNESASATISGATKITSKGYTLLSGTNTYTGGTAISAGITQFAKIVSMPATGTITVSNNKTNPAVLAVNAGGAGEFTNATSGAGSIGGLLAGVGGQGSTVTFNYFSAIGIDTTNAPGGSLTYAGQVTDVPTTLGLTKLGSGTLVLSGANTYSGVTNIAGGFLQATTGGGSNASLGNGGTMTFSGGGLQYGGTNTYDYGARIRFSASPIAIDTNGNNPTYTSNIDNSNTGGLTKLGAGKLTLSSANAYLGGTTIAGGTLAVGNNNALSVGSVTLSGGTLAANASGLNVTAALGSANTLQLSASSLLDFGPSLTNDTFRFAASSGVTWTTGATLSVYDYSGNVGGTAGDGFDHLFIGTNNSGLTAAQLAQISFYSNAGTTYLGTGRISNNGEIVPGGAASAPEPSEIALLLAGLGMMHLTGRRRRGVNAHDFAGHP